MTSLFAVFLSLPTGTFEERNMFPASTGLVAQIHLFLLGGAAESGSRPALFPLFAQVSEHDISSYVRPKAVRDSFRTTFLIPKLFFLSTRRRLTLVGLFAIRGRHVDRLGGAVYTSFV